jgi:metal-dependent amidase/aminoacylase/carboxypeptidase family protein
VRRDVLPSMAGEDFGWFLHQVPGAFVWIGNGPSTPENALHNPGYDFNDTILPAAATCLASMAIRALRTEG